MGDNSQLSFPEEDEDLEALRLAALQSLKKKSSNDSANAGHFTGVREKLNIFNGSPRGKHKRGKFGRSQQGRQTRNGQFNGWSRISNLIAVPMVPTEDEKQTQNKTTATDEPPKLILPQDRYFKRDKSPEKTDESTSKFDRYDNSDESEEESEEESDALRSKETEDKNEKPELKRCDSLEALMAELENEIQGVPSKPTEETKASTNRSKLVKKKRKVSTNAPVSTPPVVNPTISETDSKINQPISALKENLKPEQMESPNLNKKNYQNEKRDFNISRQRKWQNKPRRQHFPPPPPLIQPIAPPPELIPPIAPFVPAPVQSFPPYTQPIPFDNAVYVPPVIFETPPPQLPPIHVAPLPPVYDRPLSPLSINTDFGAPSLGQLSPRSAAFVLENRKIVEKRKRRSWSRSPSPPRFRRSKSPKRLSVSPKRLSKSPKRRSLSPSPVRKVLPPRTNSPKKPGSVHDRLGMKQKTDAEIDDKNKKSKDEKDKQKQPQSKKEEKSENLDPILEARRKKFERNEITITEGVIKLKKTQSPTEESKENGNQEKEENKTETKKDGKEEIDEDELLEGEDAEEPDESFLLDHSSLFSDEDSDSDNEGRFKTKQENKQNSKKVPVLPFTKLINGAKSEVKIDALENKNKKSSERSRRLTSKSSSTKKNEEGKMKQKMGLSDRKIEIKIRNPAKYERAKSGERKVEVAKKEEEKIEESANESIEEATNANLSDGDLRAQLSRKRAERQKHPLPDVVPSRLLQNALQGVGFRKEKKTKIKDEATEGKLPIHLRLGAANSSEVFGKKARKHKNKGSQEQV